jgi:hypothetical protein
VLEEACRDPLNLHLLILSKPNFKVVGSAAQNLQLSFLSLPEGFTHLQGTRWIEPQLRYWRAEGGGNQRYVETLENALVTALNAGPSHGSGGKRASVTDKTSTAVADHFAPSGHPGQQPWAAAASLATEQDNYYFSRLPRLPWTVEIILDSPKGRSVVMLAEASVHTSYASEEEGGGLATHVVGVLIDYDGKPLPCRLDAKVTIKARLGIGAGQEAGHGDGDKNHLQVPHASMGRGRSQDFPDEAAKDERVCSPDDRKGLTKEKCVVVGDQIRWVFRQAEPEPGLTANTQAVELQSVWYGYTVVTLLLHCCCTVVTLLLHC